MQEKTVMATCLLHDEEGRRDEGNKMYIWLCVCV